MSPRQRAIQVSNDTKARMVEYTITKGLPCSSKLVTPRQLPPLWKEDEDSYYQELRCGLVAGDPTDIALDWISHESLRSLPQTITDKSAYRATSPPLSPRPSSRRFDLHRGAGPYSVPNNGHSSHSNQQRAAGRPSPIVERVLLLSPCSESTAGGDWLTGVLGPEESLARRSNLVLSLNTPELNTPHYPLASGSGIYSPNVIVFREGPSTEDYALLHQDVWGVLSVLSVSPVKRPRLDDKGNYAFDAERQAQKEKLKLILRIAGQMGHINLCLGAFGATVGTGSRGSNNGPEASNSGAALEATSTSKSGSGSTSTTPQSDPVYGGAGRFRNPLGETIDLWKEVLLDPEFRGYFKDIIFAVQPGTDKEWTSRMKWLGRASAL